MHKNKNGLLRFIKFYNDDKDFIIKRCDEICVLPSLKNKDLPEGSHKYSNLVENSDGTFSMEISIFKLEDPMKRIEAMNNQKYNFRINFKYQGDGRFQSI